MVIYGYTHSLMQFHLRFTMLLLLKIRFSYRAVITIEYKNEIHLIAYVQAFTMQNWQKTSNIPNYFCCNLLHLRKNLESYCCILLRYCCILLH